MVLLVLVLGFIVEVVGISKLPKISFEFSAEDAEEEADGTLFAKLNFGAVVVVVVGGISKLLKISFDVVLFEADDETCDDNWNEKKIKVRRRSSKKKKKK